MTNKYDDVMALLQARHVSGVPFLDVSEPVLSAYERLVGSPFTPDYKEFVRKYGFAMSDGNMWFGSMGDPKEPEAVVNIFYGIHPGVRYDLIYQKEIFADSLSPGMLPVATSSAGLICLSAGGDDAGKVYWWDPHGGASDPWEDAQLIAVSFDSFMGSLTLVEEED